MLLCWSRPATTDGPTHRNTIGYNMSKTPHNKLTLAQLEERVKIYIENGCSVVKAAAQIGVVHSTFSHHMRKAAEAGIYVPKISEMHSAKNISAARPTVKVSPDGVVTSPFERNKEDLISREASRRGYAPDYGIDRRIPDGLNVQGLSIKRDADGNDLGGWDKLKPAGRDESEVAQFSSGKTLKKVAYLKNQVGEVIQEWNSYDADKQSPEARAAAFLAAYEAQADRIRIATPPVPTGELDDDIIPWFQIGDAHIGMLAHDSETGENFDLKIAEREICTAFSILFDEAPARKRCVLNDLGDFTHYENFAGVTEASRNPLDYDGRFPKMIETYARIMEFIIDKALTKYEVVDLIINQGNHSRTNDITFAVLLRMMYRRLYAGTNRVNVLDNSGPYIVYRMGQTLVLVHHGDKTKMSRLPQVMCQDYAQDWGETEYHYIDGGHVHHKEVVGKEDQGARIETWNTLSPRDSWHHASGYRSSQSITRVDRSRTYGEVGRRTLPIKEVRDAIKRAYGDSVYVAPTRRKVYSV